MRAREARSAAGQAQVREGARFGGRAVAGHMRASLFLRSYERSDRVYNADAGPAATPVTLQTINPHELRRRDYVTAALALLVILFLQMVGRL